MIQDIVGLKPADFKKIRRCAVQFAYQQDVKQQFVMEERAFENFVLQSTVTKEQKNFLDILLRSLFENNKKVDKLIEVNAKNWKMTRIAKVDLAILRVASIELLERRDTDLEVVIAEAVSIAQEYGSSHSAAFVNGILDAIAKSVREPKS
jgi:N utilization substance protein B